MKVVIPAAGRGERFSRNGYRVPKPLIPVGGRPMVCWALDNAKSVGQPIVALWHEDIDNFRADEIVREYCLDVEVLRIEERTEGAADTVARIVRDMADEEFVTYPVDAFVGYDLRRWVDDARGKNADASILVERATGPQFSYALCDADMRILRIAEKEVISEWCILYYYCRSTKAFVEAFECMKAQNIRTNGEFYVAPTFNQYINSGKRVIAHESTGLRWDFGTPEALEVFNRWQP